jgi:hypothetical protein
MTTRVTGAAIAAAAAVMFGSMAVTTASADEATVKCEGVNACKGQSACATAHNACQGQNSCKGKGYLVLTQSECDAAKAEMNKKKS